MSVLSSPLRLHVNHQSDRITTGLQGGRRECPYAVVHGQRGRATETAAVPLVGRDRAYSVVGHPPFVSSLDLDRQVVAQGVLVPSRHGDELEDCLVVFGDTDHSATNVAAAGGFGRWGLDHDEHHDRGQDGCGQDSDSSEHAVLQCACLLEGQAPFAHNVSCPFWVCILYHIKDL